MGFYPLVRRRLRKYAEEALKTDTDQAWAALIFAAFKYGKRQKIYDPHACLACRQRRIADSDLLTALDQGTDQAAVARALYHLHELPDAEDWLDFAINYTASNVEAVERAAVHQLGRWVNRSVVTNRLSFLSQFAKFPSVRFTCKQLLVACGKGEPIIDWLVRNSPTFLPYMPDPGMPTTANYDAWFEALPAYPVHRAPRRPTAEQLRRSLETQDDIDAQTIRAQAEAAV